MQPWRLLIDHGAPGLRQMAVDSAVLQARAEGATRPTLRLYRFDPRCVTIGRFQDSDEIDADWCAGQEIDVVRRPTGGRGVLHADELTYSIVAGCADGVPRGVAASYRHLCAGLVSAYRTLGMDAELTARDRGAGASGACYLHATNADLSIGAAKISGSAQVWHDDTCLQHGSFVRTRDVDTESRVFRLDGQETERLRRETASIAGTLGRDVSWEELREAVASGVRGALGISLEPAGLSDYEVELVESRMTTFAVRAQGAAGL